MGLIDRFRRATLVPDDDFSPMPGFRTEYGEQTRFIADPETLALMRAGRAQRTAQEQFLVLDLLAEDGRAAPDALGFVVPAEEIARLDEADARVLALPPRFAGELRATTQRWTESRGFRIDVDLLVGVHPEPAVRRGPLVKAGGQTYRVSVPLLRTLRALEEHHALAPEARTEAANVELVARLQAAQHLATDISDGSGDGDRDASFRLSLGSLDRFTTVVPDRVGLVVEPQQDGSLVVEPDLGRGTDHRLLARRWQQLDRTPGDEPGVTVPHSSEQRTPGAVLRVDDTLVLLGADQLAAVREVRGRPRIPADQAATFFRAPGSFYDPDKVDVDIRFSVRVAGLGVLAPVTFDDASTSGIAWFGDVASVSPAEALVEAIKTPADQTTAETRVTEAWEHGESVVALGETLIDVSDRSRVAEALAASRRRLDALPLDEGESISTAAEPVRTARQVKVGMHILDATGSPDELRARADAAAPRRPVDYSALRRDPFPHQRIGIEWMTGLVQSALDASEDDPARVQGALLADDMGLGKTFMTLAALGEAQRWEREHGRRPLPVLAVMPVALLENWLAEISTAFGTEHGPFDDVVVLQGDGLAQYRRRGAARETAADVDDLDEHGMVRSDRLHASLRIGPGWGDARLDRPGVLVLTTYETLRRYQVSLGLVRWGVVVLDEAQATKNPEILATRAAKGLDARFKLLATGTPVENSLRDFWSLMDTAQPGLLGTWAQFQSDWVHPMAAASGAQHERLGRALRDAVGSFMLRRVKEDHLKDLPAKHVHEYPRLMPPAQVDRYDQVLAEHRGRSGTKGGALKTLHELSAVSLHPGLLSGSLLGDPAAVEQSARTVVTVTVVLDDIRARGEKAIVFAKTKEMQRALALWLGQRYGLRVDIVNGDTAATGRGETRIAKIRAFEARDGFNVIILSPLAVGVGLTVVGANHAIHLERHWNPAKEAQATDRIHRIGQTREVHVHYPVATHPDVDSFDLNLDRLLRSKTALKDAVVVPQEVTQDQLERALGLS